MPLVLTLRSAKGSLVGQRTLAGGSLSIGRGTGNDWILTDPDRLLSKTHCAIVLQAGRCTLTDLSTNGTYVNGAREPVGRDGQVGLTDGDTIRFGDYAMTVALAASAGGGSGEGFDPFETERSADPLQGDPFEDPLAAEPVGSAGGFAHPLPSMPPALRHDDPFAADGGGLDDLLGPPPAVEWRGPTQPDKVDAPAAAFAAPRALPAIDPLDFDALIGDLALGEAPARDAPVRAAPPAPAAGTDPFASEPFAPEPFAPEPVRLAPAPTPSIPAPPPQQSSRPPTPAATIDTPVAAATGTAGAEAGLAAFLAGAGLPGLAGLPAPEEALHAAGRLFRLMVEGLREVLMSRAAIKNEMRVEQTMLRARDNNALKFSITVEEALAALLLPHRTGYKPPEAATVEAFEDIRGHEVAVMAGVQTALLGLLRRFDPSELEKRLQPGMLDRVLASQRKARNWEMFCSAYRDIAAEASDDFHAVFGAAFARAYEAQQLQQKAGL